MSRAGEINGDGKARVEGVEEVAQEFVPLQYSMFGIFGDFVLVFSSRCVVRSWRGHKVKGNGILVSNINISRNVPNCWKVAFTNGEKISKGGEKPLF